jgi:hypothetical protein
MTNNSKSVTKDSRPRSQSNPASSKASTSRSSSPWEKLLVSLDLQIQQVEVALSEKEKFAVGALSERASGKVKLGVGGQHYTTSVTTLTAEADSMLAAMFSGRHELEKDDEGRVFLDRYLKAFGLIID